MNHITEHENQREHTVDYRDNLGAVNASSGTDATPEREQGIRDFLELLYGGNGVEGYLSLFTKEDRRSYFYRLDEVDEASAQAASLSESQDVYFGVGLRRERLIKGRGKEPDVGSIPGLWVDIDVQGPNHVEQKLSPDIKSARSLLDSCPLKPSLILSTGGGLHAYWLFREPLVIRNEADMARAKTLSERFQEIFIRAASGNGWKMDNTSSLAQVLRLPGTFNHKQGVPVPVEVLERNEDNRYDPAEIEASLPTTTEVKAVAAETSSDEIPEGTRNRTLTRIGGTLRGNGMQYEAILQELTIVNQTRCRPPLEAREVDTIARSVSGYEPNRPERPSQAQRLLDLAERMVLFHTSDGEGFAEIEINDHKEVWPLNSGNIRDYLARAYFQQYRAVPNSQSLQNALNVLKGRAKFDSPEEKVHTRLAGIGNRVYLDLCNDKWEVVEIDSNGWKVVKESPVHFVRCSGMKALPTPEPGGKLHALKRLINVGDKDEDSWVLIVSWLFGCFNPTGPYPILILQGEQGSAKSTTARILRQLIDPAKAALRTFTKDERDLMISAQNGRVLAFDNLSGISHAMSDALCRLSTGGGFSTRRLYADAEEVIFDAMRPVMLNGIDDIATRSDLGDRSLVVNLPRIPDEKRKLEKDIWTELEASQPGILGALLDAVSCALRNMGSIKLNSLPRMADFAKWVVAAESKLPWKPGVFLKTYDRNREESALNCFESDNVAIVLRSFIEAMKEWKGTASELKTALESHILDHMKGMNLLDAAWPRRPATLSGRISRIAPSLRKIGISVWKGTVQGKKIWRFKLSRV